MIESKSSLLKPKLPAVTIGHEACGTIAEVGERVVGWKIGEPVGFLVYYGACYACDGCKLSPIFCPYNRMHGFTEDGFFAEYARIDSNNLVKIPQGMDLTTAAPLFCAGLTGYRSVEMSSLKAGQWLAIVGCGGLGALAVQYAKAKGLKVIGLDVVDSQLEFAKELGADAVFNTQTRKDYVEEVKKLADGVGVHAAAILSNAEAAYTNTPPILRLGGQMTYVGLTDKPIPVNTHHLAMGIYRIRGADVGTAKEAPECIQFSHDHHIVPKINPFPLEQIHELVENLKQGKLADGRYAVVFD